MLIKHFVYISCHGDIDWFSNCTLWQLVSIISQSNGREFMTTRCEKLRMLTESWPDHAIPKSFSGKYISLNTKELPTKCSPSQTHHTSFKSNHLLRNSSFTVYSWSMDEKKCRIVTTICIRTTANSITCCSNLCLLIRRWKVKNSSEVAKYV